MRHLAICEFGASLGLTGARVVVKEGESRKEFPLSRLRTIHILKRGVSLSSDLILACAQRGIKIFVTGLSPDTTSALHGLHSHAVSRVRECQFQFARSEDSQAIAAAFVSGKLRNQRALLKYYAKYQRRIRGSGLSDLLEGIEGLSKSIDSLHQRIQAKEKPELASIMGYEGLGASAYFKALRLAGLTPPDFEKRVGRGAEDAFNMCLNYGYAILSSVIWSCVVNAGLEPYCGFLHQHRAGKPSLVLDLMEEYRPWIVDRVVLGLKGQVRLQKGELSSVLRKKLAEQVLSVMQRKCRYRGKRMRVESVIQRQIYRLTGRIVEGRSFRPYIFQW